MSAIATRASAPEFRFPQDMLGEYGYVLKQTGVTPVLQNAFYVLHERVADKANQNDPEMEAASSAAQARESVERAGPRRLVIDDGQWVGFSHHDSRRLKLPVGCLPRLVQD